MDTLHSFDISKEPQNIQDQIIAALYRPLSTSMGKQRLTNGRCMKRGGKTNSKKQEVGLCSDCEKAFAPGAASSVKEKMKERQYSWPCKNCDQKAHRDVLLPDFAYLKTEKPKVMPFFAMSPLTRSGCGMWVKDVGYVWLEYGEIFVGRGDLVHAGIGYPLGDEYHRFHLFIATEEFDYDGNIYQVFES